ncbi:solanesyl-diphosphate synthase 1, mitochondrial-like isoform X2 [Dendrobium catenatum]|uniref:Solanesyl-diphosphate synthase 1, mitochondrial n=1 Tax=Dendrobium catenatum TaxID=906689 RepID=A0A2I0XHK6_9ASPA|nr:solanesyl-diphosphate synthase 1, mitochondrial-like isoform X2 [Dendrobium catenatum]PKU87396.1 Solanesyl-diphosphate synthase 1, mitochondrial [Dendrobium catenatum]
MYGRTTLRILSSRATFHYRSVERFYCAARPGPHYCRGPAMTCPKSVLGCRETYFWHSHGFHDFRYQAYEDRTSVIEEPLDPFSLVSDELSAIAKRLRLMVVAEVPKLALATECFFRMGAQGKSFRAAVLLLMSKALPMPLPQMTADGVFICLKELDARHKCIAETAEMIYVAGRLHDNVLDDAETNCVMGSLNSVMGNKLSVLAGDFLLSRAFVALANLKNTEVISLLAIVVEHLVSGETMQMTTSLEQRRSMEYYLQKTFYKTASLFANSCKAIAFLAGQTAEVELLAYNYGRNLGMAYQLIDDVLDFTGSSSSLGKGSLSDINKNIVTAPILFAMEEYPQLREVVDRGFGNRSDVELALDYLHKSRGLDRTRELAAEYADEAVKAIEALPQSDDEDVIKSRRALVNLTGRVITGTK